MTELPVCGTSNDADPGTIRHLEYTIQDLQNKLKQEKERNAIREKQLEEENKDLRMKLDSTKELKSVWILHKNKSQEFFKFTICKI